MNLDQSMLVTVTAQHAHDLRRLIGAPLAPKIAPTASKVLMLTALNTAEIDLLQTIATLFPAILRNRRSAVTGRCKILGHLADWDRYFDNWLAGLTGNATQDLYWDEDGDRFNAWLCVQRQGERGNERGPISRQSSNAGCITTRRCRR
ncbi:MAG: hypothetical protein R2932_59955 [Caldilineaceae bacterium]